VVETPPFTVRRCVGRIVELRVTRLRHVDDVVALEARVGEASPVERAIIFADYRSAKPCPQALADEWARLMRVYNGRLARSAILLDRENIAFNMQMERIVRCAGSPARRTFDDPVALRRWLSSESTEAELSRLDELLAS
jgi:hypothetical protein